MTVRHARLLAWGLFAVYVAVWVLTMGLVLFGPGGEDEVLATLVFGYALAGALVASRLPRNPIGWLLLAIGLLLALGALADANIRSADAPLMGVSASVSAWGWYLWLTLAGIYLPLLFPTGRPPSRRWRPVLWLGAAAAACSVLAVGLLPGPIETDADVPVENPVGIPGAEDILATLYEVGDALAVLAYLLAAASLVARFRHSSGPERLQLKWFVSAALVAVAGIVVASASVMLGDEDGWASVTGGVGWLTALFGIIVAIPVATGVAILRHRLFDIDLVIRRTLVYAALTGSLLVSYLGAVLLLGLALSPVTEDSGLAVAGSTLAVAALFQPLRHRIQAIVDRRFFRRRYDAGQTVESFGADLRNEVELDAVSAQLRLVAADTMQPAHVSLWLREARQ